ncbi:MAG: ABC transporter ATP-binding protein [Anaerolineae bacterium]|nr:ABC transporter ATP-binding protein [Anaerolineae bacterium]
MPPEEMIVVHDIHKSFYSRQHRKRIEAVAGVSLQVRRGETYGLIGPDGAGKTTMMRLLNGLYVPDKGWARVAGFDTAKQAKEIHRISGYMAQRFALYNDLTVIENIRFFARAHGLSRAKCDERIPQLLHFAGLEEFPSRLAAHLSGGMRKKLALATMLVHEPDIVFLDEPTLGVDPVSRREFWDLLTNLRIERGLTIFVCTPYMDEAERCHTVGLIHEGKLVAQGSPKEIASLLPGEMIELLPSHLIAEEIVSSLPGVLEVQTYGRLLRIFVDDAGQRTPQILQALHARGIEAQNVRQAEPGMEEAFIYLIKRFKRGEGQIP